MYWLIILTSLGLATVVLAIRLFYFKRIVTFPKLIPLVVCFLLWILSIVIYWNRPPVFTPVLVNVKGELKHDSLFIADHTLKEAENSMLARQQAGMKSALAKTSHSKIENDYTTLQHERLKTVSRLDELQKAIPLQTSLDSSKGIIPWAYDGKENSTLLRTAYFQKSRHLEALNELSDLNRYSSNMIAHNTIQWVPPINQYVHSDRYKNGGVVRVYFGTDRNETSSKDPYSIFGANPSENEPIRYGYCDVSIPPIHKRGELETPSFGAGDFNFFKFKLIYDSTKHIVLKHVVLLNKLNFLSRLIKDKSNETLLFVPGYNVSFGEAAKRTAQIARDLDFGGLPVFYSWPSKGSLKSYLNDASATEVSELNLTLFLEDYLRKTNKEVHLIGHSMGNRVLTEALLDLIEQKPQLVKKIKDVVLAAPDINTTYFKRKIAPALIKAKIDVTLYASSGDEALVASKKLNGVPRAGEAGPTMVIMNGLETIDATLVDAGFLGHSYIADSRSVLSDVAYLLRGIKPDSRVGLTRGDANRGLYWLFVK